jgi:hypoxanthine phosphoribosyltransferase
MTQSRMAEHVATVHSRAEKLHDAREVEAALQRMGQAITAELEGNEVVCLAVMICGMIPAAGLLRHVFLDGELDYVHVTRYRGALRGGSLIWLAQPQTPLTDRVVLLVDDILDEGLTLQALCQWCVERGARTVKTAVLVRKQLRERRSFMEPDYLGLTVPDRYVYGSGMDYRGRLRHVDGIYALAPEDERGEGLTTENVEPQRL